MNSESKRVEEVYDITGEVPLNYVERSYVDDELKSSLNRDKHLVIFGGSKQGKTCLRKHCLDDDDQVIIQCSNKWDISDVHTTILKEAGFTVTATEKTTTSGTQKIKAGFSKILNLGAENQQSESKEKTEEHLELDPNNVNDIIRALSQIGFDKYVVLEDFHYLSQEAQKDFSIALKAFHERSNLNFIIVGVWLEENRLILYNGDLRGRVLSIDVDKWEEDGLYGVIENGEEILNIEFDEDFKHMLVQNCYGSVSILQESCRLACENEEIQETQESTVTVGREQNPNKIIDEVIKTRSARYRSFLREFSEGFQATELEMYKWLLYPVLTADPEEIEGGLGYRYLRERIEESHPEGRDLNPGNLTQSLQSIASLQSDLEIKPFILDYNETNSNLTIVDRGFFIWVANTDEEKLLAFAGLSEYID